MSQRAGQVFNSSVKHDAVAAYGLQISIGIQLSQHMLLGVAGIQRHQHPFNVIGMATHLLDDVGIDRGSLNQFH